MEAHLRCKMRHYYFIIHKAIHAHKQEPKQPASALADINAPREVKMQAMHSLPFVFARAVRMLIETQIKYGSYLVRMYDEDLVQLH